MAKLFKLSAYIVSHNDIFDESNLKDYLIWCVQNELFIDHIHLASADIGPWHDDHPINNINCPEAEYEKYFKKTQPMIESLVFSPKAMHDQITAELHQKMIDQLGIKFKKEN